MNKDYFIKFVLSDLFYIGGAEFSIDKNKRINMTESECKLEISRFRSENNTTLEIGERRVVT